MDELAAVSQSATKAREWAARHEDAVVAAYAAGHSLNAIAEVSTLTLEGVRQLLLRRGVELRRRGRTT